MNISRYIILSICFLLFASCEEVIDVDLNTAPPRLVVDASILWKKGTDGALQTIVLSTTTDFYSSSIPKISGATVFVTDTKKSSFVFLETTKKGEYQCLNFLPVLGETYVLTVEYNGQIYNATETMQKVTPIESIQQINDGGFTGKEIEIEVGFSDPLEKNFYMAKFFPDFFKSPNFQVIGDEFTNGNKKSWSFSDEDLKKGTAIAITHYGISENYYNYMNKLISVASSSGGGSPFQTPPATVRGNIVNTTNGDNYALGFFSISEVDTRNYTIN